MAKTIARDTPFSEITLRRYEKPANLNDRELIRKLCLSLGLLQPGDSRDIIVDIFYIIFKEKKEMSAAEIEKKVVEIRKEQNLPMVGIAGSNVRRQLKRLRNMFLIEKKGKNYRITENMSLVEIYEDKIQKFYVDSITSRVKEYLNAIEQRKK